jgi:hypothetical protein
MLKLSCPYDSVRSFFNSKLCVILLPEPHRVTAPAPTKRCGSLRLRLRNTASNCTMQSTTSSKGRYNAVVDLKNCLPGLKLLQKLRIMCSALCHLICFSPMNSMLYCTVWKGPVLYKYNRSYECPN